MKIPINKLTKLLKSMSQWSTAMTVTVCLYVLFIMFVLSISFPLKSHKITENKRIGNDRANGIAYLKDDVDDDGDVDGVDGNSLGQNEQTLLQRANDLPAAINRTDILRDAFKK